MKMFKIILLSGLMSSAFASISCSNNSGYNVAVSNSGDVTISTPYDDVAVNKASGGGTYFYGNVVSNSIRSFSLSIKEASSRLIIIRRNAAPAMDKQNVNCSGTVN